MVSPWSTIEDVFNQHVKMCVYLSFFSESEKWLLVIVCSFVAAELFMSRTINI